MSHDDDLRALLGDPDSSLYRPPWHGAPAVITDCPGCPEIIGPAVQVNLVGRGWTCTECGQFTDWNANVTPLYPKGQEA